MPSLAHGPVASSPWTWVPHPDVWLVMAFVIGSYAAALRYLAPGRAAAGRPAATTRQKALFGAGVALLWLGSDWPMHDLSEDYLYSAHMIQHMLFTFAAPPLLLAGMPAWLLRGVLAPRPLGWVARILTRPLVALLIFNALVALTHWPALVDASLRSEPTHFVVHAVIFGSAVLMWWPVVGPLPEFPRLSEPAKLLYLFGQSILPTVPASFLTFAREPIYEFYETVPRLWGLSALTDQLLAGLIMKLGGGLLLWSIIAVMFFKWHAKEEAGEVEEVPWDEFEHELEALGLRQ